MATARLQIAYLLCTCILKGVRRQGSIVVQVRHDLRTTEPFNPLSSHLKPTRILMRVQGPQQSVYGRAGMLHKYLLRRIQMRTPWVTMVQ